MTPRESLELEARERMAQVRTMVRDTYGRAARTAEAARARALNSITPESTGTDRSACRNTSALGCGEPTTAAVLQSGETVLDLGSGPGFDCLVASLCVGKRGWVVGIDMTPEMVQLARYNAAEAGARTVSFLLGEIERLPLSDGVFDVAISNCVINLCPDKTRVFREVHRVLRRGGRLAVSDIVALAPLPREVAADLALHVGCLAGAVCVDELYAALHAAGFESPRIDIREESHELITAWAPGRGLERFVAAADIIARKR